MRTAECVNNVPASRLPHGGAILHRGLPGVLLCAAAPLTNPFGVSLAKERPRRTVIGHVLLHGHARNGAGHVESYDTKRALPAKSFFRALAEFLRRRAKFSFPGYDSNRDALWFWRQAHEFDAIIECVVEHI